MYIDYRVLRQLPIQLVANEVNIYAPQTKKEITKEKRKKHSRKAAIEPVIGHLKHDYRLQRNFL